MKTVLCNVAVALLHLMFIAAITLMERSRTHG